MQPGIIDRPAWILSIRLGHAVIEPNRWTWRWSPCAWGVGRGCWSLARHVRPSPRARQPADTRHGDDPATHMQILGVSSGHVQYAGHHVFQMHHPQMHIPCSPGLPLVCCPPGA
jgi:hypothetical protein